MTTELNNLKWHSRIISEKWFNTEKDIMQVSGFRIAFADALEYLEFSEIIRITRVLA